MLIEEHADQQGQGVAAQQLVGGGVLGDAEVGHIPHATGAELTLHVRCSTRRARTGPGKQVAGRLLAGAEGLAMPGRVVCTYTQ